MFFTVSKSLTFERKKDKRRGNFFSCHAINFNIRICYLSDFFRRRWQMTEFLIYCRF